MVKLAHKVPLILLLLEMSNKINRDRIQGILRYERLYGPWRLHLVEGKRFEQPLLEPRRLGVDGILAVTTLTEFLEPVMKARVPTVFFDTQCPQKAVNKQLGKYSTVTCDNQAVGRFAAEYFLKKGFRQFAFVADIWDSPWSDARRKGFEARLKESEATCLAYHVQSTEAQRDWGDEQRLLAEWLLALPKPIAILAASDARGRKVMDTCQMCGVKVPDDVAVLGVDNDELICATTNPPMSSILRETETSGYMAAELLDRQLRRVTRKREVRFYGPLRVEERLSTQRLDFQDPLAVKAVSFIRINAGIGMSVPDVVRHLGVSRRLAETRFRQATGHSLHEEIQVARLRQVCQLLTATDLPIGQITERCGYVTESYLGLVFRRHHGMSMREYRRGVRTCSGRGGRPLPPL